MLLLCEGHPCCARVTLVVRGSHDHCLDSAGMRDICAKLPLAEAALEGFRFP